MASRSPTAKTRTLTFAPQYALLSEPQVSGFRAPVASTPGMLDALAPMPGQADLKEETLGVMVSTREEGGREVVDVR